MITVFNIPERLKKIISLMPGASLTTGKNYNSRYEHAFYRYTLYSSRDTISGEIDNTTKAFIPATLKLGVSFGKKNKFTAGVDFVTTKWSKAINTRNLRICC